MNYNWSGFVADGVIAIKRAVKLGTTAHHVAQAGTNDFAVGVSQAAPRDPQGLPGSSSTNAADAAGDSLAVIGPGHTALITAGDTITVGTHHGVKADTDGKAVPITGDGTDNILGIPLTSGVAGDDILIYVQPMSATD